MHRFWIYPLILGVAGMLFSVLDMVPVQMLSQSLQPPPPPIIKLPAFDWGAYLWAFFIGGWPIGFGLGALLGLGAAWREHGRRGATPQSGAAMAKRMAGNVGWLLGYALLFNASIGLTLWGVAQVLGIDGTMTSRMPIYFPGYIWLIDVVNLVAIVWAARRTAHTDDILNPRVALAKLKTSTEMTPRKRKPSRHDAQV